MSDTTLVPMEAQMQLSFCSKCKEMSLMYVESFRTAHCTNSECKAVYKYDNFERYKKDRDRLAKEHAEKHGLKIAPWSGQFIESDLVVTRLYRLDKIARQIHYVFRQATIKHGMLTEEETSDFDDMANALRESMIDVARFIDDNYIPRT